MATDLYSNSVTGARIDVYQPIVPSDTVDLPYLSRAIYVGGYGDVTVINLAGQTVTFKGLFEGQMLPICAARVKATGTTATFLVNPV